MKATSQHSKSRSAFTLIEMLVVIAIIAIIAGLLFPAIGKSINAANRRKAATTASSIESAIMLYSNDYGGKLPITSAGYGQPDVLLTEDQSKNVMIVLMALDEGPNAGHALNPKRKIYFETDQSTTGGTVLDPWGNQFRIMLDTNLDGKITYLNDTDEDHRKKVVVVSGGKEGFGDDSDNVANVELNN